MISFQKYKKAKFPRQNSPLSAPRVRKNSSNNFLDGLAGSLTVDPLVDAQEQPMSVFINAHNAERPLSLDPYLDLLQNIFGYSYNDDTHEVFIEPLNDGVVNIANSAIELFGLNRKELLEARYLGLIQHRFVRQVLDAAPNAAVAQASRIMIRSNFLDPKIEFCGMYHFYEGRPIDPIPQ